MSSTPLSGSGDGTRPTTSGGVDNIGGAEKFTTTRNRAGENVSGPAPREQMQAKRKSAASSQGKDSAAFGLTEDLTPERNREPVPSDPPRPDAQAEETVAREEAIRRAAYAAYERRGGQAGDETQDWLDAEAEVARQSPGKP